MLMKLTTIERGATAGHRATWFIRAHVANSAGLLVTDDDKAEKPAAHDDAKIS